MVDHGVGAELAGALQLRVARRRDDDVGPERLRERHRCERDSAPDAPDQHPFTRLQAGPGHEHAVRGLEDEGKRRSLLERQIVGNRMNGVPRHCDQLGMRAVGRLAENVHLAVAYDRRVDDNALVRAREHAGAVGAEDARLRHRRKSFANPDIEMIERRRPQFDEHLALGGLGIRGVLVAQDLRAAVLMDSDCLHGGRILA